MMKSVIKAVLKRMLTQERFALLSDAYVRLTDGYARKSYSQEAEDLILADLMEAPRQEGFYIDIGAYHPIRYSNTWRFYCQGWHGLNIDARPGAMMAFRRLRPRDMNVEAAVSIQKCRWPFYVFSEGAFSTFDLKLALARSQSHNMTFQTMEVETQPLGEILASHLPPGQPIDFMTLDVEGGELDVLRSNDWTLFRPRWLLVECLDTGIKDLPEHPVCRFLTGLNYHPVAHTRRTVFFERA